MSTIGACHHTEDIHYIIKKPKKLPDDFKPRKPNRGALQQEGDAHRSCGCKTGGHQTFGFAHYHLDPPSAYLRKGTVKKESCKKIDKSQFCCVLEQRMPPLPKFKFECPAGKYKNFVKQNIKWADSLTPAEPHPRMVDSPRGNVQDLKYVKETLENRDSENYGKIPRYLCRRKKQWKHEADQRRLNAQAVKEYRENMGMGSMGMGENVYMVSREDRDKLLEGLKAHWAQLSQQFGVLPVLCDTTAKIRHKIHLEKEIERIEKDVKLVEMHPYIYLERQDRRRLSEIVMDQKKKEVVEEKKKGGEEVKEEVKEIRDPCAKRKEIEIEEKVCVKKEGVDDPCDAPPIPCRERKMKGPCDKEEEMKGPCGTLKEDECEKKVKRKEDDDPCEVKKNLWGGEDEVKKTCEVTKKETREKKGLCDDPCGWKPDPCA